MTFSVIFSTCGLYNGVAVKYRWRGSMFGAWLDVWTW